LAIACSDARFEACRASWICRIDAELAGSLVVRFGFSIGRLLNRLENRDRLVTNGAQLGPI
jgi:hypothetical protein